MSTQQKQSSQLEYLTQLSTTERIQEHLVSVHAGLKEQYGRGDFSPCEVFRKLYPEMLASAEAVTYLRAGVQAILMHVEAHAGDQETQILTIASLLVSAYVDGVKYAASLLDEPAKGTVN